MTNYKVGFLPREAWKSLAQTEARTDAGTAFYLGGEVFYQNPDGRAVVFIEDLTDVSSKFLGDIRLRDGTPCKKWDSHQYWDERSQWYNRGVRDKDMLCRVVVDDKPALALNRSLVTVDAEVTHVDIFPPYYGGNAKRVTYAGNGSAIVPRDLVSVLVRIYQGGAPAPNSYGGVRSRDVDIL